jgi:KDO2-lipid IV(A) lauroyltransferase
MGYPCSTVIKDSDEPAVAKIWQDIRHEVGMQWIPARPRIKAVSESLRWLKKGGILFLYADQNKSDGVYVDFFDRPAGTVEGPAMLHLRTGAEILCAFIIRQGRREHKIMITPPIKVEKTGNREEDVYQVTNAFTKAIEDFVRQYPEQWWWSHKRWKRNR